MKKTPFGPVVVVVVDVDDNDDDDPLVDFFFVSFFVVAVVSPVVGRSAGAGSLEPLRLPRAERAMPEIFFRSLCMAKSGVGEE